MNSVILLILDGWGIGKKNQGNPVAQTQTPTFDWLKSNFPHFGLQASGIAVGLPWGDPGSSEIGHQALGTGRITYQNYPKITMAIRDGSFFQNSILAQIKNQTSNSQSKLHLIGLLSSVKTNAAIEHLEAILKFAKDSGIKNVLLHLILDGKETLPKEALKLIASLENTLKTSAVGRIASLSGRYYSMDTNEYWERTQKSFELLVKGTRIKPDWKTSLEETFAKNLTEEFLEPCLIGAPEEKESLIIKDNDAVLFFNFREEGLKQLAQAFSDESFSFFPRPTLKNVFLSSLTEYQGNLKIKAIFQKPKIENSLTEVLAKNNKRQLKLGESIKDKLLTYYFNGLKNEHFENELRIILPSSKHDKDFKLQTDALTGRLLSAMEEKIYDFIVVNFANADAVGHQTNFELGREAVAYLDAVVNKISGAALKLKTPLIITSDHGNIEEMFDPQTGKPDTKHNENPVPFFLVDQRFYRLRSEKEIAENELSVKGSLADVAPTVLELMKLEKPVEMTGQSLINYCL
ncbi:MAG: 2,3-bisphosphoglycerate-independent phosphoglycerate mutase [Parcubacteria group bacterium GW2011_GWC1_45_9]|nr:MAG: 2,3-bisphosphoglycerate-independent phosphoglycerate mutase [Parcubacteria group bacterium GW2011_GWB1_45_10]KKU17388.1 MAG: 2,3-bisphosphoglycerate-independent phosphoglycerate mutase [Parcubacteria group bacterium GW2011_GWC1_45_9]HCI05364.1 2,3-bisphosphoglycerate-independent phosphoglycerate mutase [Patescibacteria group bacterium]